MEMNFNEDTWKEFLEKFSSYGGSVTDYCKENDLTKSQFYYYKKKFNKKTNPTFHAIEVKHGASTDLKVKNASKEISTIKIELGRAIIYIPSENTGLLSSLVKEILKSC
jgi:hypothetical protein